jgi:DNA-binding MarR family transcriptional regulator
MHPILFNLKRSFHATLNLTRHAFHALGVTAARFDMLYAIDAWGAQRLTQSRLRTELGVSAPTVSRMIRSLEQLGYVSRTRCSYDRRHVITRLTALGRSILRRAIALLSPNVWLAFECALTPRPWSDTACFLAMSAAESPLRSIRDAFRDPARLTYDWHPDD